MHKLFEVHYGGGEWQDEHKRLSEDFSQLFDEEKDKLGDLPRECDRLMRSYLWHYGASDPWHVLEVELVLETDLPDGRIYRGRIDLLVETPFGLYIVDHKTHKTLPDMNDRLLDAASALYLWAALRNKIPVQGFIWNYVKTKAPTVPKLAYAGTRRERLSTRTIDTDYPTMYRALKKYGMPLADHAERLAWLKSQRYQHGEPQSSSFFRRDTLHKSPEVLRQIAREALHTSKRMHEYPWDRVGHIERVPERSCKYMCSYMDLCTVELFSGTASPAANNIRRQRFTTGDPMDYYYDDPKVQWKEEG